MAESVRQQGHRLFEQVILAGLLNANSVGADIDSTARKLTALLWPFVSGDDETIIDMTLLLTAIREGAANKRLTRGDIINLCDRALERARNNPKDD